MLANLGLIAVVPTILSLLWPALAKDKWSAFTGWAFLWSLFWLGFASHALTGMHLEHN